MKRHIAAVIALLLLVGCEGKLEQNTGTTSEETEETTEPTPTPDDPLPPNQEFECADNVRDPGPVMLRRLTIPEYIETVRSTVGVNINNDANRLMPQDLRADGFSNTAYNLNVDLGHVQAYAQLAEIIVGEMDVPAFVASHISCEELTDSCITELAENVGKVLFRGPLEPDELSAFGRLADAVEAEGGDFDEAATLIVEGMLQSPRFIYRIENQVGDGSTREVGDFELASRLSYLLWGGPPDAELMAAAEAGRLSDPADVQVQVERMLQDRRAIETSTRFLHQWLHLSRLTNLSPDADRYPEWNEKLAADMERETLAFFEEVAWGQERPLPDLFNAQVTFATPTLAEHYGMEPTDTELVRYDLSDVPERGGLLTQGSILTIGGNEGSNVARGLFVLHDVLCSGVGDPPPGVDTTPVPAEPGLSQREISQARLDNPSCGGCHQAFEPLGFGLGKYDGIGGYYDVDEHGNELRDDGNLLFPEATEPIPYTNSAEMMDLLAESERTSECLTLKVSQYALGRPLVETDACILRDIRERTREGGGTYAALITAIAMSDLVHLTRTENAQ